MPQLINPNMIAEAMRRHFGVQLALERLVYRKPFPEWVDRVQFPRSFRTPDFTTFSREDGKSKMEHISQFIAQCAKVSQNDFLRLQLFPLFVTKAAFTWYSSLPLNFVQSWVNMERLFNTDFISPSQRLCARLVRYQAISERACDRVFGKI